MKTSLEFSQKDIFARLAGLHEVKEIETEMRPGAYIFQRPFLRGLFLEGLIFGGAYLRREICVSKPIGLALLLEVNLPFLLCFTLYLRAIFQVQAPGGAYIWRGLYMEGLIFGILRYLKRRHSRRRSEHPGQHRHMTKVKPEGALIH